MTRIPTPGGSPADIPSFAHSTDALPPVPTAELRYAPEPSASDRAGATPVPAAGADGPGAGEARDASVPGIPGRAVAEPGPGPSGPGVGDAADAAPSPAFGFPVPRVGAPVREGDALPQPLHLAGVLSPVALGGHPGYPSTPGPEFFGAVGDASATVSPGGAEPEAPGGPVVSYTLRVNGAMHVVDNAWLGESLLHVLRERLGLPGAKEGCGQGVCGTCTVLVDGAPVVSCMVPSATLGDREVITIEGLTAQGVPTAIQEALIAHGAVQCGFCVPGVVVSAQALLARIPHPDEATVRRALAGHPCRCVGPNRMVAAVCAVAAGEPADAPASLFQPAGAANSGSDRAGSTNSGTGQRSSGAPETGRPASAGPANSRSGTSTSSFPAVGVDLTTPTSTGIFPIPPGPAAGPAPASAG